MAKGDFSPQNGSAYPGSPLNEAAKYLQIEASRFLKGKASI